MDKYNNHTAQFKLRAVSFCKKEHSKHFNIPLPLDLIIT